MLFDHLRDFCLQHKKQTFPVIQSGQCVIIDLCPLYIDKNDKQRSDDRRCYDRCVSNCHLYHTCCQWKHQKYSKQPAQCPSFLIRFPDAILYWHRYRLQDYTDIAGMTQKRTIRLFGMYHLPQSEIPSRSTVSSDIIPLQARSVSDRSDRPVCPDVYPFF